MSADGIAIKRSIETMTDETSPEIEAQSPSAPDLEVPTYGALTEDETATPVPLDRKENSSAMSTGSSSESNGSKATTTNLLNLLGYLLALTASYLGGVGGWFGGISNSELNSKYQTLITPSAAYFGYIWATIFIFQGFFAVAQLLPKFRGEPLVQKGVGYVYFLACSAQTAWTITFGYEMMTAALVAIVVLLMTLLTILNRQWKVVIEEKRKSATSATLGETAVEELKYDSTASPPRLPYWLLRFPFAVYAGWIAPVTPLMLSVLLVERGVDPAIEIWVAVISIPLLFGGCMGLLLREEPGAPSYVFPGVVAYACAGICWELQAPSNMILGRHDEASINLTKNLSGFCGVCLVVVMITRFIALTMRNQCMKMRAENDNLEIDGEEYPYVKA